MNGSTRNEDYFLPPSHFTLEVVGVTGVLSLLANLFALIIFLCNKRLRRSSALVIALTVAHGLNGAVHTFVGFWTVLHDGSVLVTAIHCVESVWPEAFLALYQFLPLVLALNAIERLLAVTIPIWYRKRCTHRRQWYVVAATASLVFVFMIVNGLVGSMGGNLPVMDICVPPQVFGQTYTAYAAHGVAIIGGVGAILCTSVGVWYAGIKISKMPTNSPSELRRVKKQLRLTQGLLMICVVDVIFVVGPNIALGLHNLNAVDFPLRYSWYLVIIYCSDSMWNIVAFLLFNSEFRKVVLGLLSCKKSADDEPLFFVVSSQKRSRTSQRVAPDGGIQTSTV